MVDRLRRRGFSEAGGYGSATAAITVCFATAVIENVAELVLLAVRLQSPSDMSGSVQTPFVFVRVDLTVPFTLTVAFGITSPLALKTTPDSVLWALKMV